MWVCKDWYDLGGFYFYAHLVMRTNRQFHRFIRSPHHRIRISAFMVTLHLYISTAWDIRGRTLPHHTKVKRGQTSPAFNPGMTMNDHIKPMEEWRADETAYLENDFTNLRRLVQRTRSFPNLRLLSVYIDKRPPNGFMNPPASMSIDAAQVFELGKACETCLSFVVTGKEIPLGSKKLYEYGKRGRKASCD